MNMNDELNATLDNLYAIIDKIRELQCEMEDAEATPGVAPPLAQWKVNLDEIANMANRTEEIVFWIGIDPEPEPEEE